MKEDPGADMEQDPGGKDDLKKQGKPGKTKTQCKENFRLTRLKERYKGLETVRIRQMLRKNRETKYCRESD